MDLVFSRELTLQTEGSGADSTLSFGILDECDSKLGYSVRIG